MFKVELSKNSISNLRLDIDFSSVEWSELYPDNITKKFKIQELLRICSPYPDGIFPLAIKQDNTQVTLINRFFNYIEYSRVVSSEVVNISGQMYLTTKFFDNRKKGWSSTELMKKTGETLGYYINGDIYCLEDKDSVFKVFYKVVYKPLIEKNSKFLKILDMLKNGYTLTLIGSDHDFLKNFKLILLDY